MILGFLNFKGEPEKFHRRKYHLIPHSGDSIPWCKNLSGSYGQDESIFPPNFEVSLFLPLCFSPRKTFSYSENNFAEKSSKFFKIYLAEYRPLFRQLVVVMAPEKCTIRASIKSRNSFIFFS